MTISGKRKIPYLLFWNFQGLQVVTNNTQFLFKLHNFPENQKPQLNHNTGPETSDKCFAYKSSTEKYWFK